MKKLLVFTILVTAALTFTACQSTPDEPVVMQKDLEQMIEQGMETGSDEESGEESTTSPEPETGVSYAQLREHFGVPERYTASITEGKLIINCDVQVELPETTQLPMARVEAGGFSQEQVYTFWQALIGDTQMYIRPERADKEYYQQEILDAKAELAAETDEDRKQGIQGLIDYLENEYQNAPEHVDLVTADGTLSEKEMTEVSIEGSLGKYKALSATSVPFEENAVTFYVRNDVENPTGAVYSGRDEQGNYLTLAPSSTASLWFSREGERYDFYWQGHVLSEVSGLLETGEAAQGCELEATPQQAKGMVEQFLSDVQVDDMMIDTAFLCTSNPMAQIGAGEYEGYRDGDPGQQAYVFRLLRQLGGVKTESSHSWSQTSVEMAQGDEKMAVGKEWAYEYMIIAVDDEGICYLNWMAPLEITESLTQDTAMKPWSDIQSVFEKMIVIKNADYEKIETYESVQFDITQVSLSLQRIMESDSYTTGLLVPVWNFYGTTTYNDTDGESYRIDDYYKPLISINTIDGSVIDVDSGY